MKAEIEKLFENAKVVTFEQIEPFIGEDNETFWNRDKKTKGMLNFLDDIGFDIVPCRKKGEKLQSEIYVNFDKFQEDLPKPEPRIYVSEPASEILNIDIIKREALQLAKDTEKGFVEVSKYGKDGYKLFFSQTLGVDYNKLRSIVLTRLGKRMELVFDVE